jgi:hypothetical protein
MRTIEAEEARPITSSKQDQGTGKEVLNAQPQKTTPVIDADACQARHAVRMIAELKHQSRIIEVA